MPNPKLAPNRILSLEKTNRSINTKLSEKLKDGLQDG